METAVKDAGILSKESEGTTLEFDLCMLDCSFQAFASIFNCAVSFQCHSTGKGSWFFSKKNGQKYFLYINSHSNTIPQVSGRKKSNLH